VDTMPNQAWKEVYSVAEAQNLLIHRKDE